MKTSHTFPGTFYWARVQTPDTKFVDKGEEPKYRVQFYPENDEVRKAIKATGTRCNVKEDDIGWYYSFTSTEKPKVILSSGDETDALVGNGSVGEVWIEVEKFESKKWGSVVRTILRGLKLDKLLVYNPPSREEEFEDALEQRGQEAKAASMPW